jgi:hypothetical protein
MLLTQTLPFPSESEKEEPETLAIYCDKKGYGKFMFYLGYSSIAQYLMRKGCYLPQAQDLQHESTATISR